MLRPRYELGRLCLSDKDHATLEDLSERRADVRENVHELRQIVNDVDVPIGARERRALAVVGGKAILGREGDLTIAFLAGVILDKRECDPRCADEVARVLLNAASGLDTYYLTSARNHLIQIVLYPKWPRVFFRDRAAMIYLPNLQSRNPFTDEAGWGHKLPDMLAKHLVSYYGVRVSRHEIGAGGGPLFRIPGHFTQIGDSLRVGATVSSLTGRAVISDRLYMGSVASPKAFTRRIAARVIADLQAHVEVVLAPQDGALDANEDVRRAAD